MNRHQFDYPLRIECIGQPSTLEECSNQINTVITLYTWNRVSKFWPIGKDLDLSPRGGGGTPLYGLYRYVRPQRVWFFSRFGRK